METLPCQRCQLPTPTVRIHNKLVTPICEACAIKEYHESGLQAMAEAEKLRRQRLWDHLCPPAYRETIFEKLPCPAKTERVLKWQYGPKGLVLWGPTRTGKSRSAYLLLHKYFHQGKSICAYDCISFSEACEKHKYGSKSSEWLRTLAAVDLLLLDDIDKDRLAPHQEGKLFGVFDRRCAWQKPTIFTCNSNGSQLMTDCFKKHGKEFVARMREFTTAIHF